MDAPGTANNLGTLFVIFLRLNWSLFTLSVPPTWRLLLHRMCTRGDKNEMEIRAQERAAERRGILCTC